MGFQKLNKAVLFYALMVTATFVVSCSKSPKTAQDNTPVIDKVAGTNAAVSDGIGKSADTIDKHVATAEEKTPVEVKPALQPSFNGIKDETNALREMKGKLESTTADLDQLKKGEASKNQKISDLEEQNKKLSEANSNLHRQVFLWLSVASVIAIGVAAALLYTGNKLGIAIGIGAVCTLAVSILISAYMVYFAIGGGILLLAGCGYVAWELMKRKKNAEALKNENSHLEKTGKELVQTVEVAKMGMSEDARHVMFGNGPIPGHINVIQSPNTKTFVRDARKSQEVKLAPSVKPMELTQEVAAA